MNNVRRIWFETFAFVVPSRFNQSCDTLNPEPAFGCGQTRHEQSRLEIAHFRWWLVERERPFAPDVPKFGQLVAMSFDRDIKRGP